MITKDIAIEELVIKYPLAVSFLSENGIRCIRCGEPVWGTLEEAALEKGFSQDDIKQVLDGLNKLIADDGMAH
jgi:iron-sulfur cluster repair protein YtfE (RIC family)